MSILGPQINQIHQCNTIEELLYILQDVIGQVFSFNTVWLSVFDDDNYSQATITSVSGKHSQKIIQEFPVIVSDDPMMKEIYSKETPVYVENAITDPRTNKEIVEQWGCVTIVHCQLIIEGNSLGALSTCSFKEDGVVPITEHELSFFGALTKATSMALNNIKQIQQANEDPLTLLANRRGLTVKAEQLLALSKRNKSTLAVVFIDINNFKPINDKYGHDFGDLVLLYFAQTLVNTVRKSDIVARLGGDEFLLLLNDVSHETPVKKIMQDVKTQVSSANIDDTDISLAFAYGCAFYPSDDECLDSLIHKADQNMYLDKLGKEQTNVKLAD